MSYEELKVLLEKLPTYPLAQDSLSSQLHKLSLVARKLGLYDADDFIERELGSLNPDKDMLAASWAAIATQHRQERTQSLNEMSQFLQDEGFYDE